MLRLLPPVRAPYVITQFFGGDRKTYSRFGLDGHNGLDILAVHGQPVYASHEGVANYEVDGSAGHGVDLISTTKYADGYARTRYWHLCDPKKEPEFKSPIYGKKNVKVRAGDLVGFADNTGFSTGDHLHFGLKWVDKKGNNVFQNNGYKGAVDPLPFLQETEKKLEIGARGPHVTHFQGILQKLGYFPKSQKLTEYYGMITAEAYRKFRTETGFVINVDSGPTGSDGVLGYGGMETKGMFKLGVPDFVKGAAVAILAAVVTWLMGVVNAPGFEFAALDWPELFRIAFAAFLAYLAKNFVSDDKGKLAGAV